MGDVRHGVVLFGQSQVRDVNDVFSFGRAKCHSRTLSFRSRSMVALASEQAEQSSHWPQAAVDQDQPPPVDPPPKPTARLRAKARDEDSATVVRVRSPCVHTDLIPTECEKRREKPFKTGSFKLRTASRAAPPSRDRLIHSSCCRRAGAAFSDVPIQGRRTCTDPGPPPHRWLHVSANPPASGTFPPADSWSGQSHRVFEAVTAL